MKPNYINWKKRKRRSITMSQQFLIDNAKAEKRYQRKLKADERKQKECHCVKKSIMLKKLCYTKNLVIKDP